jgi:hypothetical protein
MSEQGNVIQDTAFEATEEWRAEKELLHHFEAVRNEVGAQACRDRMTILGTRAMELWNRKPEPRS